jgi:hypothetical protein
MWGTGLVGRFVTAGSLRGNQGASRSVGGQPVVRVYLLPFARTYLSRCDVLLGVLSASKIVTARNTALPSVFSSITCCTNTSNMLATSSFPSPHSSIRAFVSLPIARLSALRFLQPIPTDLRFQTLLGWCGCAFIRSDAAPSEHDTCAVQLCVS